MSDWRDTVINKGRMVDGGPVELLLEQQAQITGDIAEKAGMDKGYALAMKHCEDVIIPQAVKQARRDVVDWMADITWDWPNDELLFSSEIKKYEAGWAVNGQILIKNKSLKSGRVLIIPQEKYEELFGEL